jgi:hypothetical protein
MTKELNKLEHTIVDLMDMMDLDVISCLRVLARVACACCKASEKDFSESVKPSDLFIQFFKNDMNIK